MKCHRQNINSLEKQSLGKRLLKLIISQNIGVNASEFNFNFRKTLQTPICIFYTHVSITQQIFHCSIQKHIWASKAKSSVFIIE